MYISVTYLSNSLVLGPDRSPRESYLSHSFPHILPHAPCLPSHEWGNTNSLCWCPEYKQFQFKFDQVLLLEVGIISYVEVGDRKER